MIKYRVKGNFLSDNNKVQNINSDFFEKHNNPFKARNKAVQYFRNFIELLLIDFKADFDKIFQQKNSIEIDGNILEYVSKYGLSLEYTFDEVQFHLIDFCGEIDADTYDNIAIGLESELEYYNKHSFEYKNSQKITYCNQGEWIEGFTEDEPNTFEILETTTKFEDKSKPYWWLSLDEKKNLLKSIIQDAQIEKSLIVGENSFTEYKPALLYNFKTKKASIGVKNVIAKVICSFLNSNGGKLYIGINDNGEIQGLDYDFSLKNKEDEFDFFRIEFDNMLFQFFDKSVYHFIKADFNFDYEKPFFLVSVKPSDNPVFLVNHKDGQKEFYIRTTTSSIKINDLQEVVKYCISHWNNRNSDSA
ncbi:ATP-binding protein [Zunongwangia sp. F260]|uniref:ATP-binding protein n=1 Tax=Autumnicola lenta TaxID=3075593 RepID=A0ABU3CPZ8_9FLAO|nr:ATP-binding protein [Zunongwangia sp. F260]MDT0648424.1 ATP-binding protein [Zunongwangia sp. F260]